MLPRYHLALPPRLLVETLTLEHLALNCDHSTRSPASCQLATCHGLLDVRATNVPRVEAQDTLISIAMWVNDFFGCEECAVVAHRTAQTHEL